ncbi:MAG: pyridoxal-phosphate dependent enzyme [Candidatus Micrarchaeota archaeon]|nr:pyridoxal-phosphate dependent enzyme [Candidatus Micrarchaeota archaeon]
MKCTKCGFQTVDFSSFRCSRCQSILEVKYDYAKMRVPKALWGQRISHEKYLPFYPIDSFKVKLNEGGTHLSRRHEEGLGQVYLKMETQNPTHSFKDRGSSVEISRALELGFDHVCVASTGNMGLSIATYAKVAGIKATVFISKKANKKKIALIRQSHTRIVRVNGDFNKALASAEAFARKAGAFVCGDYHYRKEGQKSVIFEIVEQMKGHVPDFVFAPVGNSTLLAAMYKGLEEFRRFSVVNRIPRLVAVQSEKCNPLVKAFKTGKPVKYMVSKTYADAIAVGYPTFGFEGIKALKKTSGLGVSVSENEIKDAVTRLESEGVLAEPGGATGYAGLQKLLRAKSKMLWNKKVVVVITGNNEVTKYDI